MDPLMMLVDFHQCAPRVRVVLKAQGWVDMVVDHRLEVEEIVREFYVNLHKRRDDSFRTWVREKVIHLTFALLSNIMGAPQVHNLGYSWPIDDLSSDIEMVECFTDGRPHQMEIVVTQIIN